MAKISVERFHLFPTLFYKVKLPLPHEEMAEDLIKYHNDNTEEHQTAHNFDFQREFIDHIRHFSNFKKACIDLAAQYCKDQGWLVSKDKMIFGAWSNVHTKAGTQHGWHIHPRCIVSGTYYLRRENGASGIAFLRPDYQSLMHHPFPQKVNGSVPETSMNDKDFEPEAGEMLMWPSHVNHKVPKQLNDGPNRISISWNVDYNR